VAAVGGEDDVFLEQVGAGPGGHGILTLGEVQKPRHFAAGENPGGLVFEGPLPDHSRKQVNFYFFA
jgi:hypothetical protein